MAYYSALIDGLTFEIGQWEGTILVLTCRHSVAVAPWYGWSWGRILYHRQGGGSSLSHVASTESVPESFAPN